MAVPSHRLRDGRDADRLRLLEQLPAGLDPQGLPAPLRRHAPLPRRRPVLRRPHPRRHGDADHLVARHLDPGRAGLSVLMTPGRGEGVSRRHRGIL